jgi:hypothetical protein
MRVLLALGGVVALTLSVLAAPALAREHAVPAAKPAGEPADCVSISQIRSTQVRSDQVIDFEMQGGKVYRNTLPSSCPSLGFEQRFAYKTSISRLCSVDVITVLQSPGVTPGPSCGLGKFVPVTLERPAREKPAGK